MQNLHASHGPPGLPVHGIDIEIIQETEALHTAIDLDDDDLDVLPVGSLRFVANGEPNKPTSTSPAQAGLISFYTTACENMLNQQGGLSFPGDSTFTALSDFWDEHRFSIMQISDDEVVIEDRLQREQFEYHMNPRFNVIHWLAIHIAQCHQQPRRAV